MIPVQNIVTGCQAKLDAQDSDYYRFDRDYLPAIISAQSWLVGIISSAYGKKKVGEEIFQDLTVARVFQTSNFSRFVISGDDVWTILSIEPRPVTTPIYTPLTLTNPQDSVERDDLSHIESDFIAYRQTAEEWAKNKKNPFKDGHALESGEPAKYYGYINYTDYTSTNYTLTPITWEIEVRPSIANLPVTVRYAKVPTRPVNIFSTLEFPIMLENLLIVRTLAEIAFKQGDGTNIEKLADKDLLTLLNAYQ